MAKPLGCRSTAMDALRGADLTGKVALVTGWLGLPPLLFLVQPQARRCMVQQSGQPTQACANAAPPSFRFCPTLAGGNSGIGVETVRALAHAGADVLLCSRSLEAGQRVAAELQPGVKVRRGRWWRGEAGWAGGAAGRLVCRRRQAPRQQQGAAGNMPPLTFEPPNASAGQDQREAAGPG